MAEQITKDQQYSIRDSESEFIIVDNNGEIVNVKLAQLAENFKTQVELNSDIVFENDSRIAQLLQLEFDKEYKFLKDRNLEESDKNNRRILMSDDYETINVCDHEAELTDTEDYDEEEIYKTQKFNSKLSNKAFNDFKRFSHKKDKVKSTTNNKKDHAMAEYCTNHFVAISLDKMLNVTSLIHVDRDTVIFHATPNPSFTGSLPKECVIKVPKIILSEFKQWGKFVKEDHYFKDKFKKKITKYTVRKEAQREKNNLKKLRKAGVKCPKVILLKNGILVTSFLGKNQKLFPSLKDLTEDERAEAAHNAVYYLFKIYRANLVHGGLSENNILWHNKQCHFVDIGHCIERSRPEAFNYLFRDCYTLNEFVVEKKDVLLNAKLLFCEIVGCNYDDKKSLEKIRQTFIKEKED